MRAPADVVVVDSSIIVSRALDTKSRENIGRAARCRSLVTSKRAVEEVGGVLGEAVRDGRISASVARDAFAGIEIVDPPIASSLIHRAKQTLIDAPASRNGRTDDDHILALAWALDADIWSHDRDFAGTGWPSWSSANLAAALAADPAIP